MVARGVGLNGSRCAQCGADSGIRGLDVAATSPGSGEPQLAEPSALRVIDHLWHGDLRSLHVQVRNDDTVERQVRHRPLGGTWRVIRLEPGESHRFILAKSSPGETGVAVAIETGISSSLHEVFDRAHFPTVAREAGTLNADVSPLPAFQK